MAQNTTIDLVAGTWTQLTDADVTSIAFQNQTGNVLWVVATASATPPTTTAGALRIGADDGANDMTLATWFKGVSSPARVYAQSPTGGPVWVSHG